MTTLAGTATASAATVTPPAHQAGDLLVIFAFRGGSTAAPSLPSGWTSILTKSGTTCSARLGYKIATATNDASGTWTNASELTCHVYRAASGDTLGIGVSASAASTTATVNYPALSLVDASGNSWVAGFAGCNNTAETINTAPSGMTNESHVTGASYQAAGHDTEGGVSSWSSTNATTTGTATDSVSCVVEIMALPAGSTPNLFQHVAGGGNPYTRGNSGNDFKLPLLNPSGAGNTLVLWLTYDAGATVAITDSNGNTWPGTPTILASGGAGNLDSACYVLPDANAGQTIVTVAFGAAVRVFQYVVSEFYGIATASPVNGTTSSAYSTTTAAGSFTPTNNNAGGGNLIVAYFAKAEASGVPAHLTTRIVAGPSFTLLDADIGWNNANDSLVKATELCLQTTATAINPAITSIADSGDHWNSLAVALKIGSGAGTAPPSGIRIVKMHHFATEHFPASGPYLLQIPATGNLRCLMSDDPSLNALTVTDSEGNTWSGAATGTGFFYLPASVANAALVATITGGGSDTTLSWRFADIVGADDSPYDSSVAVTDTLNSKSTFTPSALPSPANTNGLVIANIGLGQGPGLAVTAPSGAVWDLCLYTGETDFDLIENADITCHYHNTASGSETWTFTITNQASNSDSGGFIAFKAASSTVLALLARSTGASGATAVPAGAAALAAKGAAANRNRPGASAATALAATANIGSRIAGLFAPIMPFFARGGGAGSAGGISTFAAEMVGRIAAQATAGSTPGGTAPLSALSTGAAAARGRLVGKLGIAARSTIAGAARGVSGSLIAMFARGSGGAPMGGTPDFPAVLGATGSGASRGRMSGVFGLNMAGRIGARAMARGAAGHVTPLFARLFGAAAGRINPAHGLALQARGGQAAAAQGAPSAPAALAAQGRGSGVAAAIMQPLFALFARGSGAGTAAGNAAFPAPLSARSRGGSTAGGALAGAAAMFGRAAAWLRGFLFSSGPPLPTMLTVAAVLGPDTFTASYSGGSVRTLTTGNGMIRRTTPLTIPAGVQLVFPAGNLVLMMGNAVPLALSALGTGAARGTPQVAPRALLAAHGRAAAMGGGTLGSGASGFALGTGTGTGQALGTGTSGTDELGIQ